MTECELNATYYPYTFTIVPSTFSKGEEEDFTIEAYSTDKDFKLIGPEDFDK